MNGRYDRGLSHGYVDIIHNGEKSHVSLEVIGRLLDITAIIRVPQVEFDGKIQVGNEYVHFGLPVYDMHQGERVLIAPIVHNGIFRNGIEKLPVLSFSGAKRATITHINDHIKYDQIDEDFSVQATIGSFQSKSHLLEVMYQRYNPVLGSSKGEIMQMGVSKRKLMVTGDLSKKEKELFE